MQRPEDETPAFVAKTGMCPQAHAIMKKVPLAECPPATATGSLGVSVADQNVPKAPASNVCGGVADENPQGWEKGL